jgi:hypothetical protein
MALMCLHASYSSNQRNADLVRAALLVIGIVGLLASLTTTPMT